MNNTDFRCDRCGPAPKYVPVGGFPNPEGEGEVWWCVKCWATAVDKSDTDALVEEEALVWGISEHTHVDVERARSLTGRNAKGIRALRTRAHMKRQGEGDDLPPIPMFFDRSHPGV